MRIIYIKEKDRELIEREFGSIIRFKKLLYNSNIHIYFKDYDGLIWFYLHSLPAIRAMTEEFVETFNSFLQDFCKTMKPYTKALEDLSKELERITQPVNQDYNHPSNASYPRIVKKVGHTYSSPNVSVKTNHRPRNNC